MSIGWVSLHRKLLNNPIVCKDGDHVAVWIYLLLNATHAEYDTIFKGERITLKAGQLITGRDVISKLFKINSSKVQRILKKLENEQQIKQQTCNANRLISIVNWSEYQQSEQQNEQRVNNKRTTNEQRVNTNNNVNNENNENNVDLTALKKPAKTIINNFKKWTEEDFKKEIKAACENKDYSLKIKKEFFDYWSETNEKGIMAFQLKKTWHTGKRLSKWNSNNNNFAKG